MALHQDSVFVGREGLIAWANFRLARLGDVLTLCGVGFGATTPAIPPAVVVSGSATLTNIAVRLGDTEATVQFAGLAPSAVGLYQFNIVVPEDAPDGDAALTISGVGQDRGHPSVAASAAAWKFRLSSSGLHSGERIVAGNQRLHLARFGEWGSSPVIGCC